MKVSTILLRWSQLYYNSPVIFSDVNFKTSVFYVSQFHCNDVICSPIENLDMTIGVHASILAKSPLKDNDEGFCSIRIS